MTINQALKWATNILKKTSLSPVLDAEVLLCHVLKPVARQFIGSDNADESARYKTFLYTNPDFKLTSRKLQLFKKLIAKRAHHVPIAYLTGHKEFFGLDFLVNKDVLIPRPETELLVELALAKVLPPQAMGRDQGRGRIKNIIDIGTGSGNIIISLTKQLARYHRLVYDTYQFYATDSSSKALRIARTNARRHEIAHRIKFLHGNLLVPFLPLLPERGRSRGGKFLILANLPYLTPRQVNSNPDLKHEPRSALVARADGLKYYRELFKQIRNASPSPLAGEGEGEGVVVLLEHDPSQKAKLKILVKKFFPSPTKISARNLGGQAKIQFHRDLAGKYRIFELAL